VTAKARTRDPADRGSLSLLTIGLALIALLLIGVVTDASRLWLAKRGLASAADSAALAGTRALDRDRYYASGPGDTLPLSPSGVRAAVRSHLKSARLDDVRATAISTDGTTVTVTLATRVELVFAGRLGIVDPTIRATAHARAAVR